MGSITGQDKASFEKAWANAEARKLGKDDRAAWQRLGHTVRPFVYFDKILIVWTLKKGEPQVLDILAINGVDVDFQNGIWVNGTGKVSDHSFAITQRPQRIAPGIDIFAWLPYFNEVRYSSQDWDNPSLPRALRLSACFKMAEDPRTGRLREGAHYLSELHVFREQFPQYADTRF